MTALVTAQGVGFAGRLRPTDVSIDAGELVCLIGPNGSGKTSLLHALAGIGRPFGRVRIAGIDPWTTPPGRRRSLLSYLPASRDIAWPLAGRDLVRLGLPDEIDDDSLATVFALLKLDAIADRRVDRLSTGERSRLLIARALAGGSRLLLLDEPTANLDPLWQLRLMDHFRAVASRRECGLLLAVHDLEVARRYADRLIVMDSGRLAADGAAADVLASDEIPRIFGVECDDTGWKITSPADRRSSR